MAHDSKSVPQENGYTSKNLNPKHKGHLGSIPFSQKEFPTESLDHPPGSPCPKGPLTFKLHQHHVLGPNPTQPCPEQQLCRPMQRPHSKRPAWGGRTSSACLPEPVPVPWGWSQGSRGTPGGRQTPVAPTPGGLRQIRMGESPQLLPQEPHLPPTPGSRQTQALVEQGTAEQGLRRASAAPSRLSREETRAEDTMSLTCSLRQCPQEVKGCSLDPEAASQGPTEAAPYTGAGGS